jgi:hypothetical protein
MPCSPFKVNRRFRGIFLLLQGRTKSKQASKQAQKRRLSTRYTALYPRLGRVISQAVSRRLPTAADRVRAQLKSCGICGGQSGTGTGFLRVLRFPLPILITLNVSHSSSVIRGWYNRLVSGRRTE